MDNDDAKNTLEQVLEKLKRLLKIIETEGSADVSFARGQLNRDIEAIYEVFAETSLEQTTTRYFILLKGTIAECTQ